MDKLQIMALMLPTGFNVIDTDESLIKPTIEHVSFNSFRTINEVIRRKSYKLILRPLSEFENSGFDIQDEILVDNLISGQSIDSMPFYLIKTLAEYNFDICGLIENGEAVDYNTIPDFSF